MTTLAQLVEQTKRHLYSAEIRDARDKLNGAIDADDTDITSTNSDPAIQRGAVLAIDLEELYVEAISGSTVTVARAEGGSTAAAHASGTPIIINPKYSAWAIFQAINDELAGLPGLGIYRVRTVDLTYAPGTDAYNLTSVTDIDDILDVEFDANDGTGRWATLPRRQWLLRRDLPTSDFASGVALTVNGYVESGQTLRAAYRSGFTALTALANDVEADSGLQASAHDILPLGAAIRLTAGAEVARNFLDQYETRRADEVPPGARSAQARGLTARYLQRIADEKARLYAKRPVMR